MVECTRVLRPASSSGHSRPSFALSLACAALTSCTQPAADDSTLKLLRSIPPSNTNLALSFDGIYDYATTGTAEFPIGRGPQAISAWFESENISGKHALITLRKDEDSGVELALQDGVLGAWRVYGNRVLLSATAAVSAGTWHHVAYTFDGTTNQLFIDGALAGSSVNLPDERTPTTSWLGTLDGTSDLFQGMIDDFRVFNVTRSASQIQAEAAGMFSVADPGLVLDLPCNEDTGSTVYDHSPLGNDGQLGDGVDQRMPSRVPSGSPDDTN
jgi:hypothetical protein